jgi:hypothetical protein
MARRRYEFVVRGSVSALELVGLEDIELVSHGTTDTRFRGWIVDQSALQGLIARLSWHGLPPLSVSPVEE